MIIMITGQHSSGKTTLARRLIEEAHRMDRYVLLLDGDQLRALTMNNDYSVAGRERNQGLAAVLAAAANDSDIVIILSLIFPRKDLRTVLKDRLGARMVYCYTTRKPRNPVCVTEYEEPSRVDCIFCCTDNFGPGYEFVVSKLKDLILNDTSPATALCDGGGI